MRLLFLFIAMMFAFGAAHAEVLGAIGTNVNYELTSNGRTYERSEPLAVRAGYRFHFADFYAEGSYVTSSSGSNLVTVGLENYEFLGWIRKSLHTGWILEPFAALGAGGHYEVVSTTFAGENSRDAGGLEFVGAAAGGLRLLLSHTVEVSLEGRATTAASYAPNPMLGFGGYLGVAF